MSLLAKCAAIAKAIGLPPDMAAGETLVAACEAMGIVPEPGATLPQIADKLMAGTSGAALPLHRRRPLRRLLRRPPLGAAGASGAGGTNGRARN